MNARIAATQRAIEQGKATAFLQGKRGYKVNVAKDQNPYIGQEEHLTKAWDRGWESEKILRTQFNPRIKGVL